MRIWMKQLEKTMPHIVTMDLSVAADFREHYCPELPKPPARHWALDHQSGRDLLTTCLRLDRPDLKVPQFKRASASLDHLLNAYIDTLGMRDMPEPITVRENIRVSWWCFKMIGKMEWQACRHAINQPA